MDDTGNAVISRPIPPKIEPLTTADLEMIDRVRDALVSRAIKPPSWRDVDPEKRTRFFDEVRGVLIAQGGDRFSVKDRKSVV